MTKYVLNSGGLRNNIPGAKKFVAELVKGFGNNPKVFFCFFAQLREVWEEKHKEFQIGFSEWLPHGVSVTFDLAFPATFEQQITKSDVLYIHGGDDHLVQYWLRQYDLPRIWVGKVVGTNSASTQVLSQSYWTCDWRQCGDGIGLLPIKTMAHFNSNYGNNDPRGPINWEKAKSELAAYGDTSLPIYALEEGEFEVFEA